MSASGLQLVIDEVELLRSSLRRWAAAAIPLLTDVFISGTVEVCLMSLRNGESANCVHER